MVVLKQCSFFGKLDDENLKRLSSFSRKKDFQKGTILFYEKEQPKCLTFLIKGVLKVYKTDLKNNEVIMHRFQAVSLVAEMPVLDILLPLPLKPMARL